LRGSRLAVIAAGCLTLGCYGLVVNMVKWDFSNWDFAIHLAAGSK
jgi:hypothetical protein